MSKHNIGFAAAGSLMTIIFLGIVNYLTSPQHAWFVYPALSLLLWPTTYMLISSKKYRAHALIGSGSILLILATMNYIHADHPWVLYALFPIVCWPIAVYSGRRASTLSFAIYISLAAIVYYSILNVLLSHQFPWAIFPSFACIWWPMTLYFVRRRLFFAYAIAASILIITFFTVVNLITSPYTIWAIYPIFAVLWWPLSVYFYHVKRERPIPVQENSNKVEGKI